MKIKDGSNSKKAKLDKNVAQERNPTEIEDLLCQLEADRDSCSASLDLMVSKILDSIKCNKRKRTDNEDSQLR